MIRAVVDANILLSGWARIESATSSPAEVVRRWLDGAYDLISLDHIIQEVERGFDKPYFRRVFPPGAMNQSLAVLSAESEIVTLSGAVVGVASHHHDDPVLETAVVGKASYLITGDQELRALGSYQDVTIVTPDEFVAILDRWEADGSPTGGAVTED